MAIHFLCFPFRTLSFVARFSSPFDINGKGLLISQCAFKSHPCYSDLEDLFHALFSCSGSFVTLFVDWSPPGMMSSFLFSPWNEAFFFFQRVVSEDTSPSLFLRYSNGSLARGFVNIFAICSFVGTYSNFTTFCATCSLRKWYLIGMCLVFEWSTGFFEILIALVLSHLIEMGS